MNDLDDFDETALTDMYRKSTHNSVDYLNNSDCYMYNVKPGRSYMSIGKNLENKGYVIGDYIIHRDMNYRRYSFTFKGLWEAWCLAKKPF